MPKNAEMNWADAKSVMNFARFLNTEHSPEQIPFLAECVRLRKLKKKYYTCEKKGEKPALRQDLLSKIKDVINQYLGPQASHPVNLAVSEMAPFTAFFPKKEEGWEKLDQINDEDLLDLYEGFVSRAGAAYAIYKLISYDSLKRFLDSNEPMKVNKQQEKKLKSDVDVLSKAAAKFNKDMYSLFTGENLAVSAELSLMRRMLQGAFPPRTPRVVLSPRGAGRPSMGGEEDRSGRERKESGQSSYAAELSPRTLLTPRPPFTPRRSPVPPPTPSCLSPRQQPWSFSLSPRQMDLVGPEDASQSSSTPSPVIPGPCEPSSTPHSPRSRLNSDLSQSSSFSPDSPMDSPPSGRRKKLS